VCVPCRYYEPIVAKNKDNLLGVTAIVLANLCVSYIMTSQVCVHHAISPGAPWCHASRTGCVRCCSVGTPDHKT
jgi:hypothetical protein